LVSLAVVVAAVVLFYSTTAAVEEPAVSGERAIARWEHLALTHDGANVSQDPQLSAQIVRVGNEGWELVCVTNVVKDGSTTKTIFYFKRPK
jgi:hypothetical protein